MTRARTRARADARLARLQEQVEGLARLREGQAPADHALGGGGGHADGDAAGVGLRALGRARLALGALVVEGPLEHVAGEHRGAAVVQEGDHAANRDRDCGCKRSNAQ